MIKILLLLFSMNLFCQEQLSVITYNMSLKNGDESRLPDMVRDLKNLDADVLCLQDVYNIPKVIKELNYPYSHYIESSENFFIKGVCPVWEIFRKGNPFYCRLKNCSDFVGNNLISCLLEKCNESLNQIKQVNNNCAQAFISHVNGNTLNDIFDLINPFKALPKFLEKGSPGLLLLSKFQLKNKDFSDFSTISTVRNRGALVADVEGFRIICANTSSPLDGPTYMGSFSSREEENKIQIEKMKKWLTGKNDVIIGNLNCSRPVQYTDIRENYSKNCEGFDELNLEEPIYSKPECTYCPYNNLVENKERGGLILDNVFISENSLIDVEVVMKNIMENESFMSDHFGVRVILKKNP
ncbi:MAG: hypothetical protein ACHQYQ_06430 [Bacteriovoracales bacterium]